MSSFYDRVFDWGIKNRGEVATQPKMEGRLEIWRELLDKNSLAPRSILDLGCGDGSLARTLAQQKFGSEFTLIDISALAVAYVNENPFPGLVEVQVSDIYTLPYKDKAFDLAVFSHTVEHLSHPRDAIVEAARVAAHVIVEIPLEDAALSNVAAWIRKKRTRLPRSMNTVGHLHFFSDETFRISIQQWNQVTVVDGIQYVPVSESKVRRVLSTILAPHHYSRLLTTHKAYLIHRC